MPGLDDIAGELRRMRRDAGSPSFARIAHDVGVRRAPAGGDAATYAPGRVTVYDCFRDGRVRLDVDLVVDVAAVLGTKGADLAAWRDRCAIATGATSATGIATTWIPAQSPSEPWVPTAVDDWSGGPLLVAGMAGAGKTSAAVRLLRRHMADGVVERALHVRLDGRHVHRDAILDAVARELGIVAPRSHADRAARVTRELAARRVGLLLDDLADVEQAAPFATVARGAIVVATSRRALDAVGFARIDLGAWDPSLTIAYLADVIGAARAATDPTAVSAIAEVADGHALHASLLAARVHARPDWSLSDHAGVVLEERDNDRLHADIRASMEATYRDLSPAAIAALQLLASGPSGGMRTSSVVDLGDGVAAASLEELRRAYLVHDADGRARLHAVVRDAVRARSARDEPPSARRRRERMLVRASCAEAWAVARSLSTTDFEARRFACEPATVSDPHVWISQDLPGVVELVVGAGARGRPWLIELAEAMSNTLVRVGLVELAEQLQTAALEASIASRDRVGEARSRVMLAMLDPAQHDGDAEIDELAIVADRAGDAATIARVWNRRGVNALRDGDDDRGVHCFERAHDVARDAGLRTLAAAYAGNLSLGCTYVGDLAGALSWNRVALEHAQRAGIDAHVATALSNLSETQRLLGDAHDAVDSATRATELAERAGDRVSLAHASLNRGAALAVLGDADRAVPWLRRAEEAMTVLGIDTMAATVHLHAGIAANLHGDEEEAARRFRAAIDAPRDNPLDRAMAMHRLARMTIDRDPAAAHALLDAGLALVDGRFDRLAAALRLDRDAARRRGG